VRADLLDPPIVHDWCAALQALRIRDCSHLEN
jgi:hypothetical protein